MKKCPYCQKGNNDEEIQCWNCGEWFEVSPPKQRNVVKPPKREQSGTDSVHWHTKLGEVFIKYRIPIISIIIIAGILFTILQNANFSKNAEQVAGIEPPKIDTPATAPEPKPFTTPDIAPASEPASTSDSAKNLFNNAFALCASGKCTDPQKAVEYLNEAIKLNPGLAQAYNNRGNAYSDLGQYQLAIADYNEAIRLKQNYANAYSNRGLAYDQIGDYQLSTEDLNEGIRLKPDNANVWSNRALTYLNHGNKNLGCPDAQKACELGYCKTLEIAKGNGMCR